MMHSSRNTRNAAPAQEAEAALQQIGGAVDRLANGLKARSAQTSRCLVPTAGTLLLVAGLAAAGVGVWLALSHRRAANPPADDVQSPPVRETQGPQYRADTVRAVTKGLAAGLRALAARHQTHQPNRRTD